MGHGDADTRALPSSNLNNNHIQKHITKTYRAKLKLELYAIVHCFYYRNRLVVRGIHIPDQSDFIRYPRPIAIAEFPLVQRVGVGVVRRPCCDGQDRADSPGIIEAKGMEIKQKMNE